jgi:TonB-linked SusC/RagA family outer membrane protein
MKMFDVIHPPTTSQHQEVSMAGSYGRTLVSRVAATALLLAVGAPPLAAQAAGGSMVRGRVVEIGGRPLDAVQVLVPGTSRVVRTDARGTYRLGGLPAGTYTIRAQQLGFGAQSRSVTVTGSDTLGVDFELRPAALSLDAVVVTGTAAESRKKEVGNSMAAISARELEAAPVKNTQDILSGRAPGITVLTNSGQPGAGGTIRLRGTNSVSQSNSPIIYVDGIRIYSDNGPISPGARQSTSSFNDIKAEDIERIEVVKGAAATTLYGTEASGGVIQIFTKKGSASAPEWSLNVGAGANHMGHVGPSEDPTGVFVNKCTGPELQDAQGAPWVDPTCPASGSWLRTGAVQQHAFSVRGGAQQTSYYLSSTFSSEEGVIATSSAKSGGVRGNFTFSPTPSLIFAFNSSYNHNQTQFIPDGNFVWGFMLNVGRGSLGNFKGGKGECAGITITCVTNGYLLDQKPTNSADHYVSGLTVNWSPTPAFTNRFALGFDYNNTDSQDIIPFGYINLPLGRIDKTDWNHTKLSLDYAGSFQHTLRGLASTSSWGGQLFDDREKFASMTGNDFSGPGDPTLGSAARVVLGRIDRPRVVNAGLFLQQMFGWRDRLFVTGGLRVDGNSAFGSGFGLQSYPKLSAAYVLSEEAFWPKEIVSTFKLRAAIGEAGKAPGAFDAVRTWDPIAADEGKPGFTPAQVGNPNLGPERTRELEFGFDAGAFEDRVSFEATAFRARTLGALIGVTYPPSEGFTRTQLENVGTLQNQGIEMQLSGDIIRRSAFEWTGRVSYTSMSNKAVDLGGRNISQGSSVYVREGYPVPSYFGNKVTNPDAFADPVIQQDAFLGNAYANHLVGLSTSVRLFKDFVIDVLGEYQGGGMLGNFVGYQNENRGVWYPCYETQKKIRSLATNPDALSDVTALQRAKCAIDPVKINSDYWVQSTDFFKIRSASLSWKLPPNLVPRTSSATLVLSGRNLWKSTDYDGLDPELRDASDQGSTLARREYYVFPPAKQFLLSMRVLF